MSAPRYEGYCGRMETLDHLRERGLVVCDTVRESPPIRQHRATPLGMQFLEILEGLVKFMEDNPELRPRYQRRKGS